MINFNGEILEKHTLLLSSQNRGFKYGDALFETIKYKNKTVQFLEDHYFRLMASMRMLRMEIPMNFTMQYFENELIKTIESNNLSNARIRFTVYRGEGGLYKPNSHKIDFIIEAETLNEIIKEHYTVDIFKDFFNYSGLLSTLKTTNKLINVLASIYASENEYDNCILLNEKKYVVEAINGNIFMVKGNIIKTPAISEGCVKGIVRKKLIEIINKNTDFTVEETEISPFELQKADELFITNTIVGIQPITKFKKSVYKTETALKLREDLVGLI